MHMQQQDSDPIEISGTSYQLPLTIKQSEPKLARLPGLLLMSTLAALIVVPQIGLGIYALASPDLRAALADHPVAAVELAVAFAFWAGLVCWPLRNIIVALTTDRLIDIRDGYVTVVDKTPFSTHGWRMPLATYDGVALYLRTSLSGVRREVVLVHPNSARSLILATAESIGEREILELCHVLGLPLLRTSGSAGPNGSSGGHKFDADLAHAGA
jgi:hypothetical protein